MVELVDETVKSVRRIAAELRPGVLDDLGLTAALDWQSHEFKTRTGIDCEFHSEVVEEIADASISIGVFRIMQEALTNVARHSNATQVKCKLTGDSKEIKLTIGDNGSGILQSAVRKNSLGILGMRERARMMNGFLAISSEPGKGTNVELIVPVNGKK
jgi:signal transduction histidine kinase